MEADLANSRRLSADRGSHLQREIGGAPFGAVVLTTPESVAYATGFRSIGAQVFSEYPLAALVSPSSITLVVPASEVAAAIDSGLRPDDILSFGTFYFEGDGPASMFSDCHPDFAEALDVAVGRTRSRGSSLGVEVPGRMASWSPGYAGTIVDATPWIGEVRGVKLPTEQQLLRVAANIAEEGIRAGIATARPGVAEREIARAVSAAMVALGGAPRFIVVTAGERSALSDAHASERTLERGDLLRFDVGCVYEGYWSDIARTVVIGAPTRRQTEYYQALRDGLAAEIDLVKPGVRADDVFAAAVNTVRARGIDAYRRHHVGHAIGMSVYERPAITANDATVLKPGMVFCLETPYYELGWGGMMVEDTGVVTETGFELFTTLDRGLAVVG
jgi:Xaa-Pro dipeptidase